MSGYMLNDEGKLFVQTAREFAEKELKPRVAEFDRSGEFPVDLYKRAADLGLSTVELSESFGGPGLDYITIAAMYEEIGRIDSGFGVSMAASFLAYKPIVLGGTPEQNELYASAIMEGKFAAFALTEPNAGSDTSAVATTAVKQGSDYVLNGSKCFITNGGVSDLYTVFASTDPDKKLRGLSCFIVEKGAKGLSVGKEENKMGIRLSNTTDVVFNDVRIPKDNLVGREGGGFKLAMRTLDLARCAIAPFAVGIARRALEEATQYAKNRKQFGNPVSALQAIQFMLADMAIRTETARQMAIHALTLVQNGLPYGMEGAIAKCYSSDIAVQNALDAIQIMGGYGYSRDMPVEKLLRDAKIFQIFEGTNQIQRAVIASHVLR
ncbi:MAG: acyl-CoA dehydrogenase family protein [Desulfovibrio sp.]|nr:acyl-CoA dehydrogenase family protein [Desulfovibrio sp.]